MKVVPLCTAFSALLLIWTAFNHRRLLGRVLAHEQNHRINHQEAFPTSKRHYINGLENAWD